MSNTTTIKVPDIGEFDDVEIIEILVHPGDTIAPEDPMITLESDKASMDIPAPQAGTVKSMQVKVGDRVSEGDPILELEVSGETSADDGEAAPGEDDGRVGAAQAASSEKSRASGSKPASAAKADSGNTDLQCQVLVLGSGPGGYTAAFRAADLGLDAIMVERYPEIGGVCLNVGCIPSKALLHAAEVIDEAERFAQFGIAFGKPKIDLEGLRKYKSGTVGKLTQGLKGLAKQRKVRVVQGVGQFASAHELAVEGPDGRQVIGFEHAIIAAGSRAVRLSGFPWDDPRVMDSTGALELADIPKRLLVVGGGIIGLEMACVYDALGSKVTVVELADTLMLGADRDLVRPLEKRIRKRYENILLKSKVAEAKAVKAGIEVRFEGEAKDLPEKDVFDRVLVAVGRSPNGQQIGAEAAGVQVTDRGFIEVDSQQRTNVEHIFAIGDIVGQPMLAHKATHEGKVAAEVIAGHNKVHFDARAIPSVAYTHPEVAWMGVTEDDAKRDGIEYTKGVFPWAASGRALALGADDGMTKLLFDADGRVIGAGIVGPNAGDLIGEAMLALEMGADMEDIGLTVHPHPTLSETVAFAAEVAHGSITDIMPPRKR
ncbi:Dihydrolipoamide dehydrogenase of pyruvate dehydrogenase complex [Thioalkalivibrio nitratireducens DSM 14787]|uniref:Dihydrolipoyl dehydrogenase n=1 Tax=Thioalkalivibrio nitratireducens (strain DSM 14787 / UNIQEM 213 / ALEN2) TaxID=1255043 RepID=L0DZB2_THIND|nr:dihydrolipoyl dehydrogenase [Thioalkalivibrio nitratireducens]AGA34305.1 Dihydrolipoamide dehydrogenase of pyruvate dehydrogenase complex [Thioalkalivibrio nitratireducens DSM 14787]